MYVTHLLLALLMHVSDTCTTTCRFLFDNTADILTGATSIPTTSVSGVIIISFNTWTSDTTSSVVEFGVSSGMTPLVFEYNKATSVDVYGVLNSGQLDRKEVRFQQLDGRGVIEVNDRFADRTTGYFEINTVHYAYNGNVNAWNSLRLLTAVTSIRITAQQNIRYIRVCSSITPAICSITTSPVTPSGIPASGTALDITCVASGAPRGATLTWTQTKLALSLTAGYPEGVLTLDDTDPDYVTTSTIHIPAYSRYFSGLYTCELAADLQYGYPSSSLTAEIPAFEVTSKTSNETGAAVTVTAAGWFGSTDVVLPMLACNMESESDVTQTLGFQDCFGTQYSDYYLQCSYMTLQYIVQGAVLDDSGNASCMFTLNKHTVSTFKVRPSHPTPDSSLPLSTILIIAGAGAGLILIIVVIGGAGLLIRQKRRKRLAMAAAKQPATILVNRLNQPPATGSNRQADPEPIVLRRPVGNDLIMANHNAYRYRS